MKLHQVNPGQASTVFFGETVSQNMQSNQKFTRIQLIYVLKMNESNQNNIQFNRVIYTDT